MFSRLRAVLFPLLRVPPEPAPPWGAPGSVRVFRAGRNYYRLRLLRWGIGQAATAIGIVVSLTFLAQLQTDIARYQAEPHPKTQGPAEVSPASTEVAPPPSFLARHGLPSGQSLPAELERPVRQMARNTPGWLFPLLSLFEYGSVLLFLAQLPLTYAFVRLDYEQHWYIVTDRSLRIRSGLLSVQETTMSFANLQQVTVAQGPVQRLLGIADVQVRSAGGGDGGEHKGSEHGDSMHLGVFHGVENALEIRDLMLERLRHFRAAGLGDIDDHREHAKPVTAAPPADAVAAARELLMETRALRRACAARDRAA